MKNILLLLLATSFLFSSCSKDLIEDQREEIQQFLDDNGLVGTETDSGLFYVEVEEGTGDNPQSNNVVEVKYVGSYLDGVVFDQTQDDDTAEFLLTQVIPGFQEGILLMKKTGKAKLIIPSRLGYGSNPSNGIRDNAILVFDTELIDF